MRESLFFSGGLNDVLLRSPEGCMVIAGGLGPRCTTQVDLPVQLGWHYQQRVWNRRISNKECRMLKGDTGLLPQEDAKRHESQWKREHSLSRRQLETYPDIAARFLQYSKFLARYSSVPAAGKYRKSRTHWTCVVQPGHRPPPTIMGPSGPQSSTLSRNWMHTESIS